MATKNTTTKKPYKCICVKTCFSDRFYEKGTIIEVPFGQRIPPHFERYKEDKEVMPPVDEPPKTFKEMNDINEKDMENIYG